MFTDGTIGKRVQRVIAIDMPGHGLSTPPSGLPGGALFGDLTIEDNAGVVVQAIDALRARGMAPRANGYNDKGPLTTTIQVAVGDPLPRPSVRPKAFAPSNGTLLSILSFSQDVLVPATDLDDLFSLMTGRLGPLYRPIVTADAVHGMLISNPSGLLQALADSF